MKVLKNFSCNGVKKKAGDNLNKEEIEKMGKFFIQFKKNDFLEGISEEKKPVVEKDNKKVTKKAAKKKE